MREYFEEWIKYIRYHIYKFLYDREQAKAESDSMKHKPDHMVGYSDFEEDNSMTDSEIDDALNNGMRRYQRDETFAEKKSRIESGVDKDWWER